MLASRNIYKILPVNPCRCNCITPDSNYATKRIGARRRFLYWISLKKFSPSVQQIWNGKSRCFMSSVTSWKTAFPKHWPSACMPIPMVVCMSSSIWTPSITAFCSHCVRTICPISKNGRTGFPGSAPIVTACCR
ncbi:hypothetical protein C8R11_102239 [Nitrosomonas aestuarii]|nr:hypothetical protein C8R11_102239 [Nitrosomonas aestuarii]